jgi:hypothetical protein
VYTEPTGNEDRDEFELSDVHAYLKDKLKRLYAVVDKYHILEDNNPEAPVAEDSEHVLKYKLQLVSCLSQQLKSLSPQGMPCNFNFCTGLAVGGYSVHNFHDKCAT